jgi:5-methylcytosine-specific restriction endonuclease McrA
MTKGYCEGRQENCGLTGCPKFGTLRVSTDSKNRIKNCGDNSAPLLRKTGKNKTPKKISFMSEKAKSQLPQREEVRRIVLQRDMGLCKAKFLVGFISCSGPLDVDEVIPRGRGGDHLNPDNCQVLCRMHHRWKHDNPAEAERLGLTKSLPPREG